MWDGEEWQHIEATNAQSEHVEIPEAVETEARRRGIVVDSSERGTARYPTTEFGTQRD